MHSVEAKRVQEKEEVTTSPDLLTDNEAVKRQQIGCTLDTEHNHTRRNYPLTGDGRYINIPTTPPPRH